MIHSHGLAVCDVEADTADLEADTLDIETTDIIEESKENVTEEDKASPIAAGEYEILELLDECRGGLTVDAIAEELSRSRTRIYTLLEQLEEAGVVKRERAGLGPRQLVFLWFLT